MLEKILTQTEFKNIRIIGPQHHHSNNNHWDPRENTLAAPQPSR